MKWPLLFALSPVGAMDIAHAQPSQAWLDQVPASAPPFDRWQEISRQSFVEVPPAKLSAAVAALKTSNSIASSTEFAGDGFSCPGSLRPYLIRALHENHGTGAFQLYWADSLLIVTHMSLGPARPPQASALVACLGKAPTAVYSSIGGAI